MRRGLVAAIAVAPWLLACGHPEDRPIAATESRAALRPALAPAPTGRVPAMRYPSVGIHPANIDSAYNPIGVYMTTKRR